MLGQSVYPGTVRSTLSIRIAWNRYRDLELESYALRVVGRGLFLAVMLMVGFLFVFTNVTDLLTGENEISIPTAVVSGDVDLGALVQGAFIRSRGATLTIVGLATLIVSAVLTSHALRRGTSAALLGRCARGLRINSMTTAYVGIGVPVLVLGTWLIALGTAIRRRAWSTLLGLDLDPVTVNIGKGLGIAASMLAILGFVLLTVRLTRGRLTRRAVIAGSGVAVVMVGCNFLLLYTYVGTLIRPQVSGGIALVLSVLLWVNIVVRTYLGAMCWVGSEPAEGASVPLTGSEGEQGSISTRQSNEG